jgi:hypothetical protein
MRQSGFILSAFIFPLGLAHGMAEAIKSDAPDKSGYHLLNPVPRHLMRELATDRPDATESPNTVDAGHFQLEMDFANFTYNHTDRDTVRAWNIAPVNIKMGLLNNVDLQLVYDNYVHVETRNDVLGASTQSGFGDLTTRLKINLWGNDDGSTAFALLPFIKFPISTGHLGNHSVEGGVIFPFGAALPANFELGAETGAGIFRNENGIGQHGEFIGSLVIGHPIVGDLSGYLEFFSIASTERHSGWVATADVGLEFLLTENIQLDCGCNIGLTPSANTARAFSGISLRF